MPSRDADRLEIQPGIDSKSRKPASGRLVDHEFSGNSRCPVVLAHQFEARMTDVVINVPAGAGEEDAFAHCLSPYFSLAHHKTAAQ